MNKELKRCVETIKSLNTEAVVNAAYINMLLTGTASVNIEATTFDKWFDEYELEPDVLYPRKVAYCEGIEFYALYSNKELSEKDKERLKELSNEEAL